MDKDTIKNMASAYQQVVEAKKAALAKKLAKASASSEKGKAAVTLPKAPWDKKEAKTEALKGDQHKLDHDKDGDIDAADFKALRKKKKADKQEGEVNMNAKLDKGGASEQKESRIRSVLKSVLENDRSKHYKGATKPETMDDKLKGQGAKDMMAPAKNAEVDDTEEKGHDDASKAARVTKPAKQRNGGDQVRSGDQKVVNAVASAYKAMKNG